MKKLSQMAARSGCLISIVAPLLGLLLYPKAKWLFALVLMGPAILVVLHRLAEDPSPHELADNMEQLLNGDYSGWAVDDYEHLSPRGPLLQEPWRKSMEIGGLPEEWAQLEEDKKATIRALIQRLRESNPKKG